MSEELPELPKELERYATKPYGGLFGNSVRINIVEEIVADPYCDYRPKDLEEMTGASSPTVRKVLNDLVALGLLVKDLGDVQHPIYHPNLRSKIIVALTFLAYALTDDREKSEYMDEVILDYYLKILKPKIEPVVVANINIAEYRLGDKTWTDATVIASGSHENQTADKIITLATGSA